MLVRNLESNIEDTEGFEVNFLHPSGTDVKGHKKIQGDYLYEQKAPLYFAVHLDAYGLSRFCMLFQLS